MPLPVFEFVGQYSMGFERIGPIRRSHYQRLRRDYIAHKKENGDCTVTQADVTFREIDRYAETLLKPSGHAQSKQCEDALAWGQELAVMRQAIEELNTKERRSFARSMT